MIKISNEHVEKLALNHYEAIVDYMGHKKIENYNELIEKDFSSGYDFKKLILAKPNELRDLKENFNGNIEEYKLFKTYYTYLNKYSDPKFFLEIKGKKVAYNAYKLVKELNISTCPYCNRNPIHNVSSSNNRTSDLDHFYPKTKYPYFAISFYNLVPSCKFCNQIKKEQEIDINPYEADFKNVNFELKVKNSTFYHTINGFDLLFESEDSEIQHQINVFKLEDLYQNHKDIVLELIQKQAIYNESYMDELMTQYEGTLFKNKEDLQRLIGGGYVSDDEIGKRPLSKLIKDISTELGLI